MEIAPGPDRHAGQSPMLAPGPNVCNGCGRLQSFYRAEKGSKCVFSSASDPDRARPGTGTDIPERAGVVAKSPADLGGPTRCRRVKTGVSGAHPPLDTLPQPPGEGDARPRSVCRAGAPRTHVRHRRGALARHRRCRPRWLADALFAERPRGGLRARSGADFKRRGVGSDPRREQLAPPFSAAGTKTDGRHGWHGAAGISRVGERIGSSACSPRARPQAVGARADPRPGRCPDAVRRRRLIWGKAADAEVP